MTRKSDKRRLELLGSAGTAMALIIAGSTFGAQIAAAATTNSNNVFAEADKTAVSQSINSAGVSASINDTLGGVYTDATSGGSNSHAATDNDVRATATGNAFHNQIDLSTVNGGAASLGVSANLAGAPITSAVTDNEVIVNLIDFSNGSAVNDRNTISATTTANRGSTLLTGPIANYSNSPLPGGILTTSAAGTTQSSGLGELVAATHQASIDPSNQATAIDNTIAAYLDSTDDNTVTASPSVSSNAISASVTGNASQSTVSIDSDNSPTYTGSAVVTNVQESLGEGKSLAVNSGSVITGEVGADGISVNALTGALTVENNAISSAASNNVALGDGAGRAGNEILLDDTLSISGSISGQNTGAALSAASNGTAYSFQTLGDLAIQNVQTVLGDAIGDRIAITAQTVDGEVFGGVEELSSGSISVAGNAITATAQSNAASSKIASGDNAALFDASVAIGNQQSNIHGDVTASNLGGTITGLVDQGFETSSVATDGNAVRASAYGNQISQSASLEATTLPLGAVEAMLTVGTMTNAMGHVVVGSSQMNIDTDVGASQSSNIASTWNAAGDSVMTGSSMSASNNTQEAVALGNSAGNGLSLAGTTVGSGAGITNFQVSDASSSVDAVSSDSQVAAFAGDSITGSELTVNDNLQRSIAYGASSSNALSVNATALEIGVTGPQPSIASSLNSVTQSLNATTESAFGLVNYQGQAGDVTATANTSTAFQNTVAGSLEGISSFPEGSSSLTTDGNTYVAAAYGTESRNIVSIEANAIDSQLNTNTVVAAAVNAQVTAEADILARASGDTVVLTSVGGDVSNSSISTSENTIQALGAGNRSSATQIAVNATNIDAVGNATVAGQASFDEATLTGTVSAGFAAQNAQFSSGSVTASLLTESIDPTSARILTVIGDDVTGSSVVSDYNVSAAGATGNRGATSILLDANGISSSAVVQSAQMNTADLTALIGVAGTPGTPGDPGTPDTPVSTTGSGSGTMSVSGDTLTIGGSAIMVTFADDSFTADEVAYLNGLSGVSGATVGGNTVTFAVGTIDMTAFNNFSFQSGSDGSGSGDETFTVTGFTIPGTPPTLPTLAIPNQGGVTVAIGGDMIGSSASVSGNSTTGSVLGNSASNALVVSATHIDNGNASTISVASLLSTDGDLALSNLQRDTSDVETSSVYGTFAIDATEGAISGSSLTVSNNAQRSDAGSNMATNVIDASGTNILAGSALASSQTSSATVSALSDLDLFAPGASSNSTIKITDNTNTARAVVNEATSVVQVEATNVGSALASPPAVISGLATVNANHAMLNVQAAQGEANSVAVSKIYNDDSASLETDGLLTGSIEFAGNATTAQSVANLATNEMTIAASANHGASAAINNAQDSSADVTAQATSTVQVVLAGNDAVAPLGLVAEDSSLRVNNNTTTAVARGNSASNVLNMEAGATYSATGSGSSIVDFGSNGLASSFQTTAGVLNQQNNTGSVSASSTGAVYQVALNGLDTGATVTGSSLNVSGNAVNAEAYGNTASNRIVMTALNSGTPSAAIGNYQSNTASVTATVNTAGYGVMAASGVIGGSTFATTGNRVAATAVGNNAVSVISAGN